MHELLEAQANVESYQHLLGGMLATFRAGDPAENEDLLAVIRSGVDLSQLAAHVRNARRANAAIHQAYAAIHFAIDGGPEELPSQNQLLNMRSESGSTSLVSGDGNSDVHQLNHFFNPTGSHETQQPDVNQLESRNRPK